MSERKFEHFDYLKDPLLGYLGDDDVIRGDFIGCELDRTDDALLPILTPCLFCGLSASRPGSDLRLTAQWNLLRMVE